MKLKPAPLGILVIGLLFIIVAAGQIVFTQKEECLNFSEAEIRIDETTLSIGFATSSIAQNKGLGGCMEVPEKSGLYFPYDPPQMVSFWMRGMLIPIDIIWIGENGVIGVEENVQPPDDITSTQLPTFTPPAPVTGVLEVRAGGAQAYDVKVGDTVILEGE